jgi:hypothetical protein
MSNKFPADMSDTQKAVETEVMPLIEQISEICKKNDLPYFFNTFFVDKSGRTLTVVSSSPSSRPEVSSTAVAHELFGMLLEHGPKFLMEMGRAMYEDHVDPESVKVGILSLQRPIDE